MSAPPKAKPNRKSRRLHRRRAEVGGLPCGCEACTVGNRWPAHYVGNGNYAVYAACQWPNNPDDGQRHPAGDLGPLVGGLAWECYLDANAPAERPPRHEWTTESPSAMAIDYLTDRHAGGVVVDLHEAELREEGVDAEVARFASLRAYLMALGLSEADRAAREARYVAIVEMWSAERHRRRRWQWLAAEFPGWEMNAEA